MGPMGTEGLFRQACEVTLRLMRDQSEPLMRYKHKYTLYYLNKWVTEVDFQSLEGTEGEVGDKERCS